MTTKERPILFSGEMVRAILDGRKTQTRRVVKPQPKPSSFKSDEELSWRQAWNLPKCPYGVPGDRLWVRETIEVLSFGAGTAQIQYRADGSTRIIGDRKLPDRLGSIPSIHVPRQASRITLEVTDVRVERLQDISEEDAQAEGIHQPAIGNISVAQKMGVCRYGFANVWESINGEESWDANPWVWVVEFKEVKR